MSPGRKGGFGPPPPLTLPGWRVVTIGTRKGVQQNFLQYTPRKPAATATAILLPGGDGVLNIQPDGTLLGGFSNFLIRSSMEFVRCGLEVALIDAPSDRLPTPGLSSGFRKTPEHASDIGAVIAKLRESASGRPVWLVGTSRGSASAANAAIELAAGAGPDGIVLSSSSMAPQDPLRPVSGTLVTMNLQRITVPTLIVHHELDECDRTPFAGVTPLFLALRKLPIAVEVKSFRDGGPVGGDPCDAFHYHGYIGIEAEVVRAMADWMKVPPKPLDLHGPVRSRLPENVQPGSFPRPSKTKGRQR